MEVEVVFPQVCGAFYKAFLLDIDLTNGRAKVGFPNNWRSVAWTELSHIRFPDSNTEGRSFQPLCKVEALLPHHDNECPGWWTGVLLKSKGELNVVEFQSGSEKYQDIVEQEKLRLPNNNAPLSKVQLSTKDFPVPDDIQDYCQRTNVHENFRAKIKAVCVTYDSTNNILTVVAGDEACLSRADILIEMHLRDLHTQKSLYTRNDMVAQRMSHQSSNQYNRPQEPGVLEVRFHVPQELVGLAIGREGANVNEARRLPGIISIEFDDYSSMFSVKGESKDALAKAREKLEYSKDTMLIPRGLAGKVIGKKGNVIQEILEKSQVNNVKVVGDDEAKKRDIDITEQVAFDFIGRRLAIENAKLMMEYHVDHLKDVETILQTRREMDPDDDTPTYYPRPREERGMFGGRGRGSRGRRRQGDRGGRQRASGSDSHTGLEDYPAEQQEEKQERTEDQTQEDEQSSDSDSGASVEEEVESDENRKSPPEDDDQGPDRRRQRSGPGRGGGGRRGRGRGGYRQNRRGRGGGRGGGRGNPEATNEETNEVVSTSGDQTGRNATASPKPQRTRGGGARSRGNQRQNNKPAEELTNGGDPNPTPEQPVVATPTNENSDPPKEDTST